MPYIIYFDIAALIITCFLLYAYIVYTHVPSWSNRMFIMTAIIVLLATATNLISCYSDFWPQQYLFWKYFIDVVHLIIGNLVPVAFYMYFYSTSHKRKSFTIKSQWFVLLLVAFEFVAIATTPFTRFVVFFDRTGVYHHGPGMTVLYILSLFFLFLTVSQIERKEEWGYRQLLMVIILYLAANILQIAIQFFNPHLMLAGFTSALSLFFSYIFLQNPLVFIDTPTGAYNKLAFENVTGDFLDSGKNGFFVFFSLTGKRTTMQKEHNCVSDIVRLCRGRNIFTIADNTFIFFCDTPEDAMREAKKMLPYLKRIETPLDAYLFVLPNCTQFDYAQSPLTVQFIEAFVSYAVTSYKWKAENVLITVDQSLIDECANRIL